MKEVWKSIPGYKGYYEVSSFGRVRSLDRMVKHSRNGTRIVRGRLMKSHLCSSGYPSIELNLKGTPKKRRVHLLMASAFYNHPNNSRIYVVDHINENKTDNRLLNLNIISQSENVRKSLIFRKSKDNKSN